MKDSEKKIILVLILVSLMVIVGVIIWKNNRISKNNQNQQNTETMEQNEIEEEYVQKLENNEKLNISEKVKEKKTLEGIEFTNIQLTAINGKSMMLADVENKTGRRIEEKLLKIEILNKQGEVTETVTTAIGGIEAGGKGTLTANITVDIANAYDVRFTNL